MKRLVLFLTLAAGCATVLTARAQSIDSRLKQLFPSATSFSPKEGDPPHFTAYTGGAAKTVAGSIEDCTVDAAGAIIAKCPVGVTGARITRGSDLERPTRIWLIKLDRKLSELRL